MPSTFEPSVHDKLAQAQYEEMLRARVLSEFESAYCSTACLTHSADQAKSAYAEDLCQTCKFEVVISYPDKDGADNRDFIIVSLTLDTFDCDHNPNKSALQVLLQSEATSNVKRAYESLVDALRVKMARSLG
jgi:hypothetical protein